MLNIDGFNDYEDGKHHTIEKGQDKNVVQFIATVFQTCVSFLIGKFFFGRSVSLIYIIIIFVFMIDIIYITLKAFIDEESGQMIRTVCVGLFDIKSTMVYMLYYQIC